MLPSLPYNVLCMLPSLLYNVLCMLPSLLYKILCMLHSLQYNVLCMLPSLLYNLLCMLPSLLYYELLMEVSHNLISYTKFAFLFSNKLYRGYTSTEFIWNCLLENFINEGVDVVLHLNWGIYSKIKYFSHSHDNMCAVSLDRSNDRTFTLILSVKRTVIDKRRLSTHHRR